MSDYRDKNFHIERTPDGLSVGGKMRKIEKLINHGSEIV